MEVVVVVLPTLVMYITVCTPPVWKMMTVMMIKRTIINTTCWLQSSDEYAYHISLQHSEVARLTCCAGRGFRRAVFHSALHTTAPAVAADGQPSVRMRAHRTVVGPRSTTAVPARLRAKWTHVQHRPCYVAKASDAFEDSLQAGPISLSLCLSLYRSCKFLLIFFGIVILLSLFPRFLSLFPVTFLSSHFLLPRFLSMPWSKLVCKWTQHLQ